MLSSKRKLPPRTTPRLRLPVLAQRIGVEKQPTMLGVLPQRALPKPRMLLARRLRVVLAVKLLRKTIIP